MTHNKLVRPFLKWAGGKRQLLPEIESYLPSDRANLSKHTYYEPFIGGGAVFFHLQLKKAVVSDSNQELINCYQTIKDSLDDLIVELTRHQENNSQEYYYSIRELDRHPQKYASLSPVERAARIIYLNKTCYNGLFRVNSQGQFNVPYGRYKNPNIVDSAALKAVNKYLNKSQVKLVNADFAEALKDAKKGDFVYLDPPYHPVSNTASFTGYDVNGFNQEEQIRLKNLFDNLTKRGCKVMLSNSYTDFIKDLYQDYQHNFQIVSSTRNINSNASKRGCVSEILVLNYSPKERRK